MRAGRETLRWAGPGALWLVVLGALATWSDTSAGLWIAAAATVLLGAAIGRPAVLLVPAVPGVLLIGWILVTRFGEGSIDDSPESLAGGVAMFTVVPIALLGAGVLVRSGARAMRRRSVGP